MIFFGGRNVLPLKLVHNGHNGHGEDEKGEADHVSNKNEETNNAHYMSDDDRNACEILA